MILNPPNIINGHESGEWSEVNSENALNNSVDSMYPYSTEKNIRFYVLTSYHTNEQLANRIGFFLDELGSMYSVY